MINKHAIIFFLFFLVYTEGFAQVCADSAELVRLYRATDGANWKVRDTLGKKSPWILTQPMTTWYGVTMNTEGCVICIDLDGNADCMSRLEGGMNLVGTVPNLNLPNLQILSLSNNKLSGVIPNFSLPNLQFLHLDYNQLSGTIPNLSLPNLRYLFLDFNQLTGTIPNFTLPNLQVLHLGDNRLSGTIPVFNTNNLSALYLNNNQLTGTIPNFSYASLTTLFLQDNQLSGTIPNFILPNLQRFFAYNNQLSGTIPNFSLPNLLSLSLSANQLSGRIPSFNVPRLLALNLQHNQLTGELPNFMMPQLESFDVSHNALSGAITNFNFPNLVHLFLNDNGFSGAIPSFNLIPNTRRLYLQNNQLDNCFPANLSRFCRLGQSNDNNFDGFNFNNNPKLPWRGDFQRFCNNDVQVGATCNDGLVRTINDIIRADCACLGTDTSSCIGTKTTKRDSFCSGTTYTFLDNSTTSTIGNFQKIQTGSNNCPDTTVYILSFKTSLKINKLDSFCNGSTYTFPDGSTTSIGGNFQKILRGVNGCSDTTIFTLSFKTGLKTNKLDSFCNGSTYTFPDGSTTSIGGNFQKILRGGNGCSDTTIFTLSFKTGLKTNKLDSFCNGSTYTFPDGSTTSIGGNFQKILRGVNGCSDTTIYTLSFKTGLKTNKLDSFCNGSNYIFPDGSTTAIGGNFQKIGRGVNGCSDTTVFTLSFKNGLKINKLDSFCNGSNYVFPDGSTTATSGNFQKIGRGVNGCSDTTVFVLTYKTTRVKTLDEKFCDSFRLPSGRIVKEAGTYSDSVNCESVFSIKLTRRTDCGVPPKVNEDGCSPLSVIALTPNDDGFNDVLDFPQIPDIERFPKSSLQIFSRWGGLVYEASPYTRNWTGENKENAPLPNGAYAFILKLNVADRRCYMGMVEIFR
jgi:gliding motility-associated-like protein